MDRRGFLKTLGLVGAGLLIEEPIRKLWFVPSSAPVGSRIERLAEPDPIWGPIDMNELKAILKRKVRSQEDLDALRAASRHAEAMLSMREQQRLIAELFPKSAYSLPINEFGYDPADDDDLHYSGPRVLA